MRISITKAMPEDAGALLQFLKTVGSETDNLTFGAEGLPVSVEDEEKYLDSLDSDTNIMLLAKKDGEILGCASFNGMVRERMKHRGSIAVSVKKSHWGQGIGSMLLQAVIDFARQTAKAQIISLEVRSDNLRAIKLYEKYGFKKIGHFKGFFIIDGVDVDCDLMNLYL